MVALKIEYDGEVIALSTGVAFIGAFAAVSLCEQFRMSTIATANRNPLVWITFAALSFAGVGIWGMHFIAMTSFKLTYDGVEVPMRFNIGILFVSLAVVTVLEFVGLYLASTDPCFNKSKNEIIELFISRASTSYTMTQIKQLGKFEILRIVCTHNLGRIILGGFIGGAGVAVMHYLGMMTLEFQGQIKYNAGLVALAVIIAVLSVIGGFWIFFRILSLFPSLDILRVACALNGMFSLSGVHYIGLVSATYEYDPSAPAVEAHSSVSKKQLLTSILVASVVFCVLMQVYVLSDLRSWLLRTSGQLRQADNIINALSKATAQRPDNTPGPAARDLVKYLCRYKQRLGSTASTLGIEDKSNRDGLLYNDYSDDEEPSELTDNYNNNNRTNSPRSPQTPTNSYLLPRVKPPPCSSTGNSNRTTYRSSSLSGANAVTAMRLLTSPVSENYASSPASPESESATNPDVNDNKGAEGERDAEVNGNFLV